MQKPIQGLSFLCAGLSVLTIIAGCGSKGTDTQTGGTGTTTASSDKQVVIVSPHSQDIQTEFERVWKQKHPDVALKWIDKGGTSDDLRFVQAQFKTKPDGIGVDCFFGGGGETFLELEKDGDLQPLSSDYDVPANLNGVPLRGEKNMWVAAALSGFGVLYNKSYATRDKLPVPVTWGDLANPKLQGRVELADPRHSGSAHAAYEIILQTNGWEQGWKILTAMAANSSRFARSSSDLPQDVAKGDAVFAPAIDFYARAAIARAGEDKLGFVLPKGQSVITPDPIGLLKGAPHQELAKDFVDFVMSPEAQKLWMMKKGSAGGPTQNELFRQAALPSLYKPIAKDSLITADPYSFKNERPYDAAKAAARRRPLDELIGAVLIDNHDIIAAKWAKNPNLAAIGYVPVKEDEIKQIADKWSDANFRTQTVATWGEAAQKFFGS